MLWHRTESWESNYTFTRLRRVKCDHSLQPTNCSTLNYSHLLSWDPLNKEKQLCRQKHVKNMELKEDFVAVTRDLEFWRDGGRKDRTLVGASFSMECLLCGAMRLSGWGVEDIGRNCGGTGKRQNGGQKLSWRTTSKSMTCFWWTANTKFWIFHDGSYSFCRWRTLEMCLQPVRWICWSCCQIYECFGPPGVRKRGYC